MSGLFSSLNASVKAITAHSRALETAGKNLANVNNPNYARQRVIYGDRGTVATPTGAESLGLEALGVEQIRDVLLDRQVAREISLKSSFEAEQSGYQRAQAGLGQSIDRSSSAAATGTAGDKGISAALDDFFNAFQSFAAHAGLLDLFDKAEAGFEITGFARRHKPAHGAWDNLVRDQRIARAFFL